MVDGLASFLIYCGLIVWHYIYIPLSYRLVRSANQIWFSFVVLLFRRLPFDHVTTCYLYCRWRAGVAATEKDRKIMMKNCWELVFQYRRRIRWCWRRVFQHWGWMTEGCWEMVFEQHGWMMCWMMVFQQRDEAIAGRNCFVDEGVKKMMERDKKCWTVVFQHRGDGWKVADNLCFSNGKSCCEWCCRKGRGRKNETSAGRSCFGSENDGGMGCFCDWEEVKSAEQRCFGVGEQSPVFFSGVSALENWTVLHRGVSASEK